MTLVRKTSTSSAARSTGSLGEASIHGPGTFLHFESGTSHTPSTETGGELFVYYPFG